MLAATDGLAQRGQQGQPDARDHGIARANLGVQSSPKELRRNAAEEPHERQEKRQSCQNKREYYSNHIARGSFKSRSYCSECNGGYHGKSNNTRFWK